MYKKANDLNAIFGAVTPANFQLQFNKWDKELTEPMIVAEGRCRQFKNNDIAFSPIVVKWIKRLNLFRWIKEYKNGGKVNKSNLVQTCTKTANVNHPDTYSLDEVMVEEHACLSFLEELRATAPYLRLQHLRD